MSDFNKKGLDREFDKKGGPQPPMDTRGKGFPKKKKKGGGQFNLPRTKAGK